MQVFEVYEGSARHMERAKGHLKTFTCVNPTRKDARQTQVFYIAGQQVDWPRNIPLSQRYGRTIRAPAPAETPAYPDSTTYLRLWAENYRIERK